MAGIVVVGAQWGDEGKGKIVDILTEFADTVVRYQGGANAGHTVLVGDRKTVLHLIPSGALRKSTRCMLGQGMVVDPEALIAELDGLAAGDHPIGTDRLLISPRCHLILPLHVAADEAEERLRGAAGLGTTMRGIGPCYEDKAGRRGLRFADLDDPGRLRDLIAAATRARARTLEEAGVAVPDVGATVERLLAARERLSPFLGDVSRALDEHLRKGRNVLFEGAQGTLLDLDHGTYPFVTSSSAAAAGACTGTGVGPMSIDGVVGVCKAYATRVGAGPFPTEGDEGTAARLREAGGEFGATTGRPRRCGWLDVPALRYAVRINGIRSLALTKLDVLAAVGADLRICTAYEVDGSVEREIPIDRIDRARPVYETIKAIPDGLRALRSFDDLPAPARRYVAHVERLVGVPVCLLSVGPRRSETILRENPFHLSAATARAGRERPWTRSSRTR